MYNLLKEEIISRLNMYEAEYNDADKRFPPDVAERYKATIREAATSFADGVQLVVLFGIGNDAYLKVSDLFQNLDSDVLKGQTITGIAVL